MGRIRDTSKHTAAEPIRFPECLAIDAQTAMAIMIAKNNRPKISLKNSPPSLPVEFSYICQTEYTIFRKILASTVIFPDFIHRLSVLMQ